MNFFTDTEFLYINSVHKKKQIMNYDEYLKIKGAEDSEATKGADTSGCVRTVFRITDDKHLKQVKDAVEEYEEENFNLTYEDFQKMDECLEDAIGQLKYTGDGEVGYEESELSRIVRVMRFLDWNYALSEHDEITEEECLRCLWDVYRSAMKCATEYKSKRVHVGSGGWFVNANFETHSLIIHFCLFEHYADYDEMIEIKSR